ncbi:hypothetical protein Cch01nite_32160 [Cellulomonas chitinilytica]|uniref:Uncharacterized protein n=1 Tax=Cellulomonas chitinilytica TaxID=398759 RepID=A0A919U3J1_9CELL|nr:hypothetical protein Cch01nite_32160 [Cellulomonas chitinilytica]
MCEWRSTGLSNVSWSGDIVISFGDVDRSSGGIDNDVDPASATLTADGPGAGKSFACVAVGVPLFGRS